MPIIKYKDCENKEYTKDFGFYSVVFKNDLIKIDKNIFEVECFFVSELDHVIRVKVYSTVDDEYDSSDYSSKYFLYKRPLKNWFNYIMLKITKKYKQYV